MTEMAEIDGIRSTMLWIVFSFRDMILRSKFPRFSYLFEMGFPVTLSGQILSLGYWEMFQQESSIFTFPYLLDK